MVWVGRKKVGKWLLKLRLYENGNPTSWGHWLNCGPPRKVATLSLGDRWFPFLCYVSQYTYTRITLQFRLIRYVQYLSNGLGSQTTWTSFGLLLTTYTPLLTISTLYTLTKSQHFLTSYPPPLVNVVCECPLTLNWLWFLRPLNYKEIIGWMG